MFNGDLDCPISGIAIMFIAGSSLFIFYQPDIEHQDTFACGAGIADIYHSDT